MYEPIAITGAGCIFPGGATSLDGYWSVLRAGRPLTRTVPADRWGADIEGEGAFLETIELWDHERFGISEAEALRMDPQHRLLLDAVWNALEDAAIAPRALSGTSTGVFVGVSDSQQYTRLQQESDPSCETDPFLAMGNSASVAAGRVAYWLDLTGPTLTIDTACSTSLVAVHLACESLRRGECDLALVVASSAVLHPQVFESAYGIGMLAGDGRCKTFSRAADGFGIGEGAGAVLLERLADVDQSRRRIRAVIRGSAINQDGASGIIAAPKREAQEAVLRLALQRSGLTAGDIHVIESHGSGTPLGDAVELQALHNVLGPGRSEPLPLGAVKTLLGHTLLAAGMAGLLKLVLELEHRVVTPNALIDQPNPILRRTTSVTPAQSMLPLDDDVVRGGVSAFGWSGTNGHVIVESAPERAAGLPDTSGSPVLLTLSEQDDDRLTAWAAVLGEHLADCVAPVGDVAWTLQLARSGWPVRRAAVVDDNASAVAACADVATPRARATDGPVDLLVTDVDLPPIAPRHIEPREVPLDDIDWSEPTSSEVWCSAGEQLRRLSVLVSLLERLRESGLRATHTRGLGLGSTAVQLVFGTEDAASLWAEAGAVAAARAGTPITTPEPSVPDEDAFAVRVGAGVTGGPDPAVALAGCADDAERSWLESVGRIWERVSTVDIAGLVAPGTGPVLLPPAPSRAKRLWPTVPVRSDARPYETEPGERSLACFTPVWKQVLDGGQTAPGSGEFVVLVGGDLARAVSTELQAHDFHTVVVDSSASPEEIRAAVEASDQERRDLHLVDISPASVPQAEPGAAFNRLLGRVQELSRIPGRRLASMLVVSAAGVSVAGESTPSLGDAALHGMVRAVAVEVPSMRTSALDLPAGCRPDLAATVIAAEIADRRSAPPGSVIAIRSGRRYVEELTRIDVRPADAVTRGVWIVTGGTRGLGSFVARQLARTGASGIVLVGRTNLPGRASWAEVLDKSDGPVCEAIRTVRELEDLGVPVLPLCADVGRPGRMARVLEAAEQHFGSLEGVVHCAGLPASGILHGIDHESASAVIGVKAAGLDSLEEWIDQGRLHSVVLFSSAASVFGGLGEADYCAANRCLDAFALRHAQSPARVLSVSWGPWVHDAWSQINDVPAPLTDIQQYRAESGISEIEGMQMLSDLLATPHAHVVVIPEGSGSAEPVRAGQTFEADILSEIVPPAERRPRPALSVPFRAPVTPLEKKVATLWADALGLVEVGTDDPFFEVGGTSLIGVAAIRRLERELGTSLHPGLLFEFPTAGLLAEFLQPEGTALRPDVLLGASAGGDVA